MLGDLFHVEVDAVQDRPLVDHEHRELLEDARQLLDGLGDLPDLLVALLDEVLDVDDGAHLLLVEGHACIIS